MGIIFSKSYDENQILPKCVHARRSGAQISGAIQLPYESVLVITFRKNCPQDLKMVYSSWYELKLPTHRARAARASAKYTFLQILYSTLRRTSHHSDGPRNFDTLVFRGPAARSNACACSYKTRKTRRVRDLCLVFWTPSWGALIHIKSDRKTRRAILYNLREKSSPKIKNLQSYSNTHHLNTPFEQSSPVVRRRLVGLKIKFSIY
jgi:hypothetical protein